MPWVDSRFTTPVNIHLSVFRKLSTCLYALFWLETVLVACHDLLLTFVWFAEIFTWWLDRHTLIIGPCAESHLKTVSRLPPLDLLEACAEVGALSQAKLLALVYSYIYPIVTIVHYVASYNCTCFLAHLLVYNGWRINVIDPTHSELQSGRGRQTSHSKKACIW